MLLGRNEDLAIAGGAYRLTHRGGESRIPWTLLGQDVSSGCLDCTADEDSVREIDRPEYVIDGTRRVVPGAAPAGLLAGPLGAPSAGVLAGIPALQCD